MSPTLAWLAVGPGTKATFYPGPKGNRDKWPGTKAYSVVVEVPSHAQRYHIFQALSSPKEINSFFCVTFFFCKVIHVRGKKNEKEQNIHLGTTIFVA